MPEQQVNTKELPKVDSFDTPVVLADSVHGMSVHEGMVAMNFAAMRFSVPGSELPQLFHQSVLRLVMPAEAFSRFVVFLHEQHDQMVKDGVIKKADETKNG